MTEIHLYDFDGTLFRSPMPPATWDGDWWNATASLMPPCVPNEPGHDWWIHDTIAAARESIANPNAYAILATGRGDRSGLRWRVPELLHQVGLRFDSVNLAPDSGTLAWKKHLLQSALLRVSNATPDDVSVHIWDDRLHHLAQFKQVALLLGINPENIHLNHVHARGHNPECAENIPQGLPPQPTNAAYIGVFLTSASQSDLVHAFPYIHEKMKAEHLTLAFKPKPNDPRLTRVGEIIAMDVIGYAEDDLGQAVLVQPVGIDADNKYPHVTLSHDPAAPGGAAYSNTLLASTPVTPMNGPRLYGILDTFPRSLTVKNASTRVANRYLTANETSYFMNLDAEAKKLVHGALIHELRDYINMPGATRMNPSTGLRWKDVRFKMITDTIVQITDFPVPEVAFAEFDPTRHEVRITAKGGKVLAHAPLHLGFRVYTQRELKDVGRKIASEMGRLLSQLQRDLYVAPPPTAEKLKRDEEQEKTWARIREQDERAERNQRAQQAWEKKERDQFRVLTVSYIAQALMEHIQKSGVNLHTNSEWKGDNAGTVTTVGDIQVEVRLYSHETGEIAIYETKASRPLAITKDFDRANVKAFADAALKTIIKHRLNPLIEAEKGAIAERARKEQEERNRPVAPPPAESESEEVWSVARDGYMLADVGEADEDHSQGYIAEVETFNSKAKAMAHARDIAPAYVVKGTQMWNEPVGQVEEDDRPHGRAWYTLVQIPRSER